MPAKSSLASFEPTEKIPLPTFLKLLTSSGLVVDKAMSVASKIYKTHNTPVTLAQLTDVVLAGLHVDDKEQRRLVLAAVKPGGADRSRDPVTAALSASKSTSKKKKPSPKKRKVDDLDELHLEAPRDEAAEYGNFVFNDILEEEALMTKSAVVNRAPVMAAWAMIVAERMGFKREEALSIAQVYTEMNATSKGVKLGLFEEGRGKGMEATEHGAQPYVDFMDRRPVFSTRSSQWRALMKGEPVSPSSAYAYITKSFRQTTAHVVGAMRLLAESFPPQELNRVAFGLYADFRPKVEGWGKKGELRCESILSLRKKGKVSGEGAASAPVIIPDQSDVREPDSKKHKKEDSVEDYEAALDAEGYDDLFVDDGA